MRQELGAANQSLSVYEQDINDLAEENKKLKAALDQAKERILFLMGQEGKTTLDIDSCPKWFVQVKNYL